MKTTVPELSAEEILEIDHRHIWHPYSSIHSQAPLYPVERAEGCTIYLKDGRALLDGMSSWWSAIHGYNHPELNQALVHQCQQFAHVMFGGFTHAPAAQLAKTLTELAPAGLNRVFLADSGSVSVEVAIKMALQFWLSKNQTNKNKLVSLRNGYHGDTLGAMSVCDPITGMHHLFKDILPQQFFLDAPSSGFDESCNANDLAQLQTMFAEHSDQLAAIILEPIVQGTGGMRFYSPDYLKKVRELCDQHQVLLIADEIATGFGRSGKLFACEYAEISPDILCLGKALTGGYMTLAATLCTDKVASGICEGEAGVFMHGPTFMGNPLACAVANANLSLLLKNDWAAQVKRIEQQLLNQLSECKSIPGVADVRVLGAIGVVEMNKAVDMTRIIPLFVKHGIWIRPFGKLVYTMPPFVISEDELQSLCSALISSLKEYGAD